jgi:hypothetical protein
MWTDPYTGIAPEGTKKKELFITNRMFTIFVITVQILAHQYLIQRDLIMAVIEKFIVTKQQTQMHEYLMKSRDAKIVAVIEDGQTRIELCNSKASALLGLNQSIG